MRSTYHFHFFRSSWGVAVWLTAEAVMANQQYDGGIQITSRLQLEVLDARLQEDEIKYLKKGLESVAHLVQQYASSDGTIVVRILNTEYTPTDYQPEGMYYAVIGWVAKEFGFDCPSVKAEFDELANRYFFDI